MPQSAAKRLTDLEKYFAQNFLPWEQLLVLADALLQAVTLACDKETTRKITLEFDRILDEAVQGFTKSQRATEPTSSVHSKGMRRKV